MCSSSCVPRCPSCAGASPPALVRLAHRPALSAPCACGARGLVLASSGAASPWLWCAWCGAASPAPARSRWSAAPARRPPPPQLSLFSLL